MVREHGESQPSTKKLSGSVLVPTDNQENVSKQDQIFNKEPIESEIIMEFSPGTFETPLLDEELNSGKDISIGEPKPNDEGL